MPLEGGQTRTGVEREANPPEGGKRTGSSGQEGGQSRTGTESETSAPEGGKRSGDSGLNAGQKKIGTERETGNAGSRDYPSGRLDEVREVG